MDIGHTVVHLEKFQVLRLGILVLSNVNSGIFGKVIADMEIPVKPFLKK